MYALPDSFEPAVLNGRTLEEVSFTQNTVRFAFDPDALITVLGGIEIEDRSDAERPKTVQQRVPIGESDLMQLVGRRVISADADQNSNLQIEFDPQAYLRVLADSDDFECYWLAVDGDEIVV